MIKAMYKKLTDSIILSGEKLNTFPLRSGTRQESLLLPLLLGIESEVLSGEIRQEKEIKAILIGKEEVRLFLFIGDTILCVETTRESTKTTKKHWRVY